MPVQFFADSQRERLNRFPDTIQHDDLITFFTLSDSDKATIPVYSGAANRLGFALQLCALRFMGFFPENLQTTPFPIVEYVASQLGVDPQALVEYGNRAHTKTDHQISRRPKSCVISFVAEIFYIKGCNLEVTHC